MKAAPLICVSVILRERPGVRDLEHVGALLSAFLDPSSDMTLAHACSFDSVALLDRIWTNSCVSVDDWTAGWSPSNYLRSDRHYNAWQFSQALEVVASRGHLPTVEWLFSHFMVCWSRIQVVEAAARAGHLSVLKFLLRFEVSARLKQGLNLDIGNWNMVYFGGDDTYEAVKNGHSEVVHWLIEQTGGLQRGRPRRSTSELIDAALDNGDLQLMEWLRAHDSSTDVRYNYKAAARSGHPVTIQWMITQGHLKNAQLFDKALENVVRRGHLELVQRLVNECAPVDRSKKQRWGHYRRALMVASEFGHLHIVRWLAEEQLESLPFLLGTDESMHRAAFNGHLQVVKYLQMKGVLGSWEGAMFGAAIRGNLHAVKWIYDTYKEEALVKSQVIVEQMHGMPVHGREFAVTPTTIMDAAAVHGHLDVLQFLHDVDRSVKLHRSERGRKLEAGRVAMNGAAERGHLEVVKWLHEHRSEGCTTAAMDLAAAWGHLDVVKWLHSTRSEGCTSNAMDNAAANGHLKVVQFLHANRSEGCTTAAIEEATTNGHFDVVLFLHSQRTEGYSREWLRKSRVLLSTDIRRWLRKHYPAPASNH